MAEELERLYFKDYSETWWHFLRSIEFEPFDNISTASNRLKTIGDFMESPLIQLVNSVSQQTRFESPSIAGFKEKASQLLSIFKWGHTFVELNQERLEDYAKAKDSTEIIKLQARVVENMKTR